MSFRSQLNMQSHKFPSGIVQWSLAFNLAELETEHFQDECLELPRPLLRAIKKRQIEFLAGRLCAKRCLEDLDLSPPPSIGINEDRSPIWPKMVIGSISHTDGLATAIVGPASQLESLGIDREKLILSATPPLIQHICIDQEELESLARKLRLSPEQALTLIFSGKESFYKALHPILKQFFGFHAARVTATNNLDVQIELVTELSNRFTMGRKWALNYSQISPDIFETMVIETKKSPQS